MKKVLGLDLGTTSIGWAIVNQAENSSEKSSIIKAGVRVNPLTVDEKDAFEKGKAITTNADRTLKRSMRRNLQRYKLRRDGLIDIIKREGWLKGESLQAETNTYETLYLRAKAVTEPISLQNLARVLININKKRGYKSSRKSVDSEEGHLIDGMDLAKYLYNNNITPGEYCLEQLKKDSKKALPEFYRSDLIKELDSIWSTQKLFYPDILTEEFYSQIQGRSTTNTSKIFFAKYNINTADNKGKEKRYQEYVWRTHALKEKLPIDQMAYVIAAVNGDISSSSSHLGSISDRSKELFFNNQTIGQYLYSELQKNPSFSTKGKVFYRQDYIDEFEKIWDCQSKVHPELNETLRKEIRDNVIFYQRRLRSQKGLLSYCELESHKVETIVNGKKVEKTIGVKVAPRSSFVFQEFKIWQTLNNLEISKKDGSSVFPLELEEKQQLFSELQTKKKMSSAEVLKSLRLNPREYETNFKEIEGNRTLYEFYSAFLRVVSDSGNGEHEIDKICTDDVLEILGNVFSTLGFNTDILGIDTTLDKDEFERQPLFKLWHLLYSYDGDKSPTGDESLVEKISVLCNMPVEYARVISRITFQDDYSSLSNKAMMKILPYLREGNDYSTACVYAGYNHSKRSLSKEQIESKVLKDHIDVLPKNSLRNPVVEKILNQMINVVNSLGDTYGRPDEIHVEMARELKMGQKERQEMDRRRADNTKRNAEIEDELKKEFHIPFVRKNDILRYKLYEELKANGYKTLYSNQYIPKDKIFSKEIDIEHIIPQARLFDDSFSNKTLEYKSINIEKGKKTAADYVREKYGEAGFGEYKARIEDLYNNGSIGKEKKRKLLMSGSEIPEDFIERDLRNSQYIARKAVELLGSYARVIVHTTGSITAKLREDWQLIDVMKQINFPKYDKLGLTTVRVDPDGRPIKYIADDWSKRNDHRHHAMDAITIAFTKPSHIIYLNSINAASDTSSNVYAIRQKDTILDGTKRVFAPPMPLNELRSEVKNQLDSILVSIKAKNKVVTKNVNKSKKKGGANSVITLTPRGAMHKETIYGKRQKYETFYVSVGAKLTKEVIEQVASKIERLALMARLEEFGCDPKKAFTGKNSIDKNPVYLDANHLRKIGDKVKCVKTGSYYSVRKPLDSTLTVEKVIDKNIRELLEKRVAEKGKSAFSNLEEDPLWFNKEKGIRVKRVAIAENYDLDPIRIKKNHEGRVILDHEGKQIPADYVNFRNNHHIAIYEDAEGNLQEKVVPFYEAVNRKVSGLAAVDKEYKKEEGWKFLFTMKINEMFVFPNPETGFDPLKINLLDEKNASLISPNLFRVQKLSSKFYQFRHHLETVLDDKLIMKDITWKRIQSLPPLREIVKVRIDNIGRIVSVGEYD